VWRVTTSAPKPMQTSSRLSPSVGSHLSWSRDSSMLSPLGRPPPPPRAARPRDCDAAYLSLSTPRFSEWVIRSGHEAESLKADAMDVASLCLGGNHCVSRWQSLCGA
jgi:hypothetical protein